MSTSPKSGNDSNPSSDESSTSFSAEEAERVAAQFRPVWEVDDTSDGSNDPGSAPAADVPNDTSAASTTEDTPIPSSQPAESAQGVDSAEKPDSALDAVPPPKQSVPERKVVRAQPSDSVPPIPIKRNAQNWKIVVGFLAVAAIVGVLALFRFLATPEQAPTPPAVSPTTTAAPVPTPDVPAAPSQVTPEDQPSPPPPPPAQTEDTSRSKDTPKPVGKKVAPPHPAPPPDKPPPDVPKPEPPQPQPKKPRSDDIVRKAPF